MSSLSIKIENPGTQELRKFGLVFGAIVAVLFGLFLPWAFDYAWPVWPWILSGISCFWGMAHPASLFVVYRTWMKFGHVMGWINTRIILGIMFYVIFFPAGVLMRLVAKDPRQGNWMVQHKVIALHQKSQKKIISRDLTKCLN